MKKNKSAAVTVIFFLLSGAAFASALFFESAYQMPLPVLYESNTSNPSATLQALPPLNELLSDHKIEPLKIRYSREVSRSL